MHKMRHLLLCVSVGNSRRMTTTSDSESSIVRQRIRMTSTTWFRSVVRRVIFRYKMETSCATKLVSVSIRYRFSISICFSWCRVFLIFAYFYLKQMLRYVERTLHSLFIVKIFNTTLQSLIWSKKNVHIEQVSYHDKFLDKIKIRMAAEKNLKVFTL